MGRVRALARRERLGDLQGPCPDLGGGEAVEAVRGVRELGKGEGEERRGGTDPSCGEVDASRGDLDQPLEVPPPSAFRAEPDGLPLLVSSEVETGPEGVEPPGEGFAVAGQGRVQAFGRAERISSISSASTYPSTRLTTFPVPSTKRIVG